jgi:hypothetical protein
VVELVWIGLARGHPAAKSMGFLEHHDFGAVF